MTSIFGFFSNRNNSRTILFFEQHKSLYDNFISLCSLTKYRADSPETAQLLTVLKACRLHSTHTNLTPLNQTQRREDIARLEIARLAIEDWLTKRSNSSSRAESVIKLLDSVNSMRSRIINLDSRDRTSSMWFNILHSKNEVAKYLSPRLGQWYANQAPSQQQNVIRSARSLS